MITFGKQNLKPEKKQTLWCLPYDTDTVFKPLLKVPFSLYLNNIISNQYFQAYQSAMAREIGDQNQWNDKCWKIIQFFQFLNQRFEMNEWDQHINFIEDTNLRSTMGYFRLWIDTQRLYLINFLKLDSNEFQQDRIFMALFRTLNYFNTFFTEYLPKDFDQNFLSSFSKQATHLLQRIESNSTNQTAEVVEQIINLLANIKKRERNLINSIVFNSIKKSAVIKVGKEDQAIDEIEMRLFNSAIFKKRNDEQTRLKMIAKKSFIDQFVEGLKASYDPLERIRVQFQNDYYYQKQEKKDEKAKQLSQKLTQHKKLMRSPVQVEVNSFEVLEQNHHNPYSLTNYQIYGEPVKINMQNRMKYEKNNDTQVISVEDYDRSKLYYDEAFMKEVQTTDFQIGRVSYRDVNISNKSMKKKKEYKDVQNENTRVFNLKWHAGKNSGERKSQGLTDDPFSKDYDNNLLFKTPLQDQLDQRKKKKIDRIKDQYRAKTYTVAWFQHNANQIHPENINSSFGSNLFFNKQSPILDLKNFKLLNQNKFDFMRKVVGYMTAQKKINNIIIEKSIPDSYPRVFSDIKQDSYNPRLQQEKVKFVLGRTDKRPDLCL